MLKTTYKLFGNSGIALQLRGGWKCVHLSYLPVIFCPILHNL